MLRVGYHVRHGKSLLAEMEKACALIEDYGFKPYLQIFVCGPQNHTMVHITDEEIKGIRSIPHIIHGAYVSYPWNNASGTIHNLGLEFKMAKRLASDGVIVHMGAGIADDKILESVRRHVGDGKLWLELAACKPSSPNAFDTPSKVNKVLQRVGARLVIDTAHLWSMGVSFTTYNEAITWLNKLNQPLECIIHLNDSLDILGGGRDIHAACGKGNIWSKYYKRRRQYGLNPSDSGIAACIEWAKKHNYPIILERGDDVRSELELIAELCSL